MSIWEMQGAFADEWVVLDREMRVVDKGPSLDELRRRNIALEGRCTYFFVQKN